MKLSFVSLRFFFSFFLALWESGHGGNSALVVEVSGHFDVSVHSPVSSPRVLNQPEGGSRVNTPSNGEDSVIKLRSAASWLVVDSRAVELEGVLRSIDGNRGWSSGDLNLEIVLITRVDIDEALKGGTRVGSAVAASSILSGVWVARLSVDSSVGDNVGHGLSHESSIASLVSLRSGAIHQVLLRERDKLLCGDHVATLC